MFKAEITRGDIINAISKALGERVVIVEEKTENGNKKLSVRKIDTKTRRFTEDILIIERKEGNLYKALVLYCLCLFKDYNIENIK